MKLSKAQQANHRMKWAGYRYMWKVLSRQNWLGPLCAKIQFPWINVKKVTYEELIKSTAGSSR